MKSFYKIIIVMAIVIGCTVGISSAQDYLLGPGDVLDIGVWGYTEWDHKGIIVRPDGKITLPAVGEIRVSGKTPGEVTSILTTELSRYLKNPLVSINVARFRMTRVYVLGEVQKPGMYDIDKQHTLMDAIGMAGGYTKNAAKKKVQIIRQDKDGQLVIANVLNLLRKGDISQNYVLSEGDIVYLGRNGRIDFAKDILPWVSLGFQIREWND